MHWVNQVRPETMTFSLKTSKISAQAKQWIVIEDSLEQRLQAAKQLLVTRVHSFPALSRQGHAQVWRCRILAFSMTRLPAVFAFPCRALRLLSPMISSIRFVLFIQVRGQKISPASRCPSRSLRLSCQPRLRAGSITCVRRSVPPPGISSLVSWMTWLPSRSRAECPRRVDPGSGEPPSWPFSAKPNGSLRPIASAVLCRHSRASFRGHE